MRAVAKILRITHLLDKKPSALSGGDMQRVAIGRALVRRPKAMLMDEPIGALDAKLREEMRAEIKRLHMKQGSTTIYVTHDQVEAMSLADRIVIMHEGVLQQIGTPAGGLSRIRPICSSRSFVGSPVMNIVAGGSVARPAAGAASPWTALPRASPSRASCLPSSAQPRRVSGKLALGIRPEGVLVERDARGRLSAGRGARSSSRSAPTTSSTSRSARRC